MKAKFYFKDEREKRQFIMAHLTECPSSYGLQYPKSQCYESCVKCWEKALDNNKLETESKWIPCKEAPPYSDGEYLVTILGSLTPTTLFYNKKYDLWLDAEMLQYRVTAWQPLPEQYKEG